MQRIAITGTDGSGKTTIIRRLAAAYADAPQSVRAFRAPQYHEDPDLPFGALALAVDQLSVLADRRGDALLKATALFLSMTLFGDVERFAAAAYRPRFLVSERQCLADSLTYARFYLPLLRGPLDREIEPEIVAALGADGWRRVRAWLGVFQARDAEFGPVDFFALPLAIRALFESPGPVLLERLMRLYHAEVPDRIVLLQVSGPALAARLAEKRGAAPTEVHEQAQVLAMFQQALSASCEQLQRIHPALKVDVIDTSQQSSAESEVAIRALLNLT